MGTRMTMVAVAQLDVHPAIVLPDRSPLQDPLFDLNTADSLHLAREPEEELADRFQALRARIEETYCRQLLLRVRAILEQCRQWGVEVLVFPEYSLPWQVLEEVAKAAPGLVIVGGTHTVSRAARKSGLYERPRFDELPAEVRTLLSENPEKRPPFFSLAPAVRALLQHAGLCTDTGVWMTDPPFFDWIKRMVEGRALGAQL